MKTAIVMLQDLKIASIYEGSANQSAYGGPWGKTSHSRHVEFDDTLFDKDCIKTYLTQATAEHDSVTFTADIAGEEGNNIILEFNGIIDIDTAIANSGASVSHNGIGTDILSESGTLQLSGGGIGIQEDQNLLDAKLQMARNVKLFEMRKQRDILAKEADYELNKHIDSDSNAVGLEADWKTYRVALRNITDPHKDGNGDGSSALDAFVTDLSDFTWPVKPS